MADHALLELCPATGGEHDWVDELTVAQLMTGLRPKRGYTVRCAECGVSFTHPGGRPEP